MMDGAAATQYGRRHFQPGAFRAMRRPVWQGGDPGRLLHGNDDMLGERLKELRGARGLTLRALARRADVSPTLISLIERSRADPSMDTLRRLAAALGESIASLFAEPAPANIWLTRPGERPACPSSDGQLGCERLTPLHATSQLFRGSLDPGQRVTGARESHPSLLCLCVTAGTLVAEVSGVSYPLLAGESIAFDARLHHGWRNTGTQAGEFVLSLAIQGAHDAPRVTDIPTQRPLHPSWMSARIGVSSVPRPLPNGHDPSVAVPVSRAAPAVHPERVSASPAACTTPASVVLTSVDVARS